MSNPTNTPKRADLLGRINSRLRSSEAWRDLFEATSTVINDLVTMPREQLQTVRDPRLHRRGDWMTLPDGRRAQVNHVEIRGPEETDILHVQLPDDDKPLEIEITSALKSTQIQINNASFSGFKYFSSFMTQEDYARIAEWVEIFWPRSGSEDWIGFMGFTKDMALSLDHLWSGDLFPKNPTQDLAAYAAMVEPYLDLNYYPYLEPVPESDTVMTNPNNDAYPTSHVDLRYDAVRTPNPDILDLMLLFYYLAPIHLVLHRIVGDVAPPPIVINHAVRPAVSFHDSANFIMEPDGYVDVVHAVRAGHVGVHETSLLAITVDDDEFSYESPGTPI